MVALYQISTNTVIQNWGVQTPQAMYVPTIGTIYGPPSNWSFGDYELIPVVYVSNPSGGFSIANGQTQAVTNGQLVVTLQWYDPPLSAVQAYLCNQIEETAETIREKYMFDSTVWQSVMVFRYLEAINIQANSNPIANNYPLNNAMIGVPGVANITQAAAATMNQYNTWIPTEAQIENIRLTARSSINAANSIPNAIAAYQAVNWGSL